MITIQKTEIESRNICINTLAQAFKDDPVVNWFIRQDRRHDEAMRIFFDVAFSDLTFPHGHVYSSADNSGVALWTPPGKWKLGFFKQLKLLSDYTKAFQLKRLLHVIPPIQLMQNLHPDFPHYYLFALGVAPEMQNKGLGSLLLKEVLQKCDREMLPAYLEATTPSNRELYLRHGFKVVKNFRLASDGPEMWFMLRNPKF